MRTLLLSVAVVVSLWPAAVIALGVERVLGGGGGSAEPVVARPAPTPPPVATTAATTPSRPPSAGASDLGGLNRLRDDTADLVVIVDESGALGGGLPDAAIAAQALDVEAAIVAWQAANEGVNADATFFAGLFAAIAAAAADYATAPSPETKQRLSRAVERHRRETLQGGA